MYQSLDIESAADPREEETSPHSGWKKKSVGVLFLMMVVLGAAMVLRQPNSTEARKQNIESTSSGVGMKVEEDHHHSKSKRATVTSGTYMILNVNSGKPMEAEGGFAHRGARVIQNKASGTPSQAWQLKAAGKSGNVYIKSVATGLYLDVKGRSKANGAKLIEWSYHGGANQKFRVEKLGDGTVRILAVHSKKVVDVPGGSIADKVQLIQWTWHGGKNQKFRLVSAPGYGDGECPSPHVRRDFADLTQKERDTFLKGYRALRSNGRLEHMAYEHKEALITGFDGTTFHGNIGFYPWHRYYIWELEHQIRALGGEFKCVTLPYWDFTRTSGKPVGDNPIFSQGVGGNGNPPGKCVMDGLLGQPTGYKTTYGQCLKRKFETGISPYPTSQQVLREVELVQNYSMFRAQMEGHHNLVHKSIGADMVNLSTTTDDVLFFMLHSFVDMMWALRADCHDYDQASQITPEIFPEPWKVMNFPFLAKTSWALVSHVTLTAADLLKTSDWDYTYDASNIMSRTCMAMNTCQFDTIFGRVATEEDMLSAAVDGKNDEEKAHNACMRDPAHCTYTEPLEKCGEGPQPLQISLQALLNKKGVKGNTCVENARKEIYDWAKITGTLRGVCNGLEDKTCPP